MNQADKNSLILHQIELMNINGLVNLISNGVDLECKNRDYKTPLHLAVELRAKDIVKILIDAGAKVESPRLIGQLAQFVTDEISEFPVAILKILVESGLNINYPGEDGDTLLIEASLEGNLLLVQKLVELGSEPNILNKYGEFALLFTREKREIFDYLYPITDPVLRERIPWQTI